MAACNTRARRFADDSSGLNDSVQKAQRSQRKSARKVIQEADDGKKRCAGSKSKKGVKGGGKKIEDGVSDRIGEGVVNGVDERVGEGIDGGLDEGIDGPQSRKAGKSGGAKGMEVLSGMESEGEEASEEVIKCLCACRVEKGEMVCCDVCKSWSHLKCIGMKEGVKVIEGKEFVCYFCLSACLLALQREVGGLREELNAVKSDLKEASEESNRLKKQMEKERAEVSVSKQKSGRTSGEESGIIVGKKNSGRVGVEESEIDAGKQNSGRVGVEGSGINVGKQNSRSVGVEESWINVGKQKSKGKEVKRGIKWASGVRKVWGTRKKDSCNEVAKEIIRAVGKMGSEFSVRKQVAELNGKYGWWFIVKAPERCLVVVDEKWEHRHWQWQKVRRGESDFLGVGPVSAGHR